MRKQGYIIEKIAKFASSQDLDTIPKKTKKFLRLLILDWISVTLAGKNESVFKIISELEKNNGGKKESLVLGLSDRLPAQSAANMNAVAGHALDYDDTHFGSLGHTTSVVISAALAASDKEKSGARLFREGVLVGIETAIRIGIWLGRKHYHKGFHITATAGIFGSTVAVARILGLSKKKIMHAIGIASSSSSGIKAHFGSMAKPLQVGFASSRGLEAAYLAQKGIKSNNQIFDDKNSYGMVYSANFIDKAFSNLGCVFNIDDLKFKFHACCHGTHSAIEALIYLRDKYKIKAKSIRNIKIFINPQYLNICNIQHPKNGLQIKFSYKMLASLTMHKFNTASLNTFSKDNCKKKKLVKIAEKVDIIPNEKISETETKVLIITKNSKPLSKSYDLLDKISLSSLNKKLFIKTNSLLGKQNSKKLWFDKSFNTTLPSVWIEKNIKY